MSEELTRQEVIEDAPIEQIITEEFVARFEKQAELYQARYLPICLKLTNEKDWVNHGKGRYSLQCSGAEKVCNPLGMVWDRPVVVKHERQDEKGPYYEYEVEGILQSRVLKRYGWFTGNCSSRDVFFNARGHFDEGDIRKAAFSNWLVNGITRLAGIRNPDDEILRRAGLDPGKIGQVEYRSAAQSQQKTLEGGQDVISEAQAKRFYAIAKGQNLADELIHLYLWENYKIKSSKEIKKKDYDSIVSWAQAGGQKEPTQ